MNKYMDDYVPPIVILIVDIVLSFASSVLSIVLLSYLSQWFYNHLHSLFAITWTVVAAVMTLLVAKVSKCYKTPIRHSDQIYNFRLLLAILCKSVFTAIVTLAIMHCVRGNEDLYKVALYIGITDFGITFLVLICVRMLMFMVFALYRDGLKMKEGCTNVLIYGTTNKSTALVERLQISERYNVIGFVYEKKIANVGGLRNNLPLLICENEKQLQEVVEKYHIGAILFPNDTNLDKLQDTFLDYCTKHKIEKLITPPIDELNKENINYRIRKVEYTDILGRKEIEVDLEKIKDYFKGKTVLVTGAAGSIGSELCRQLASFGVSNLVLFDDAETPMHELRLELEGKYKDIVNIYPTIGDVRHKKRLEGIFSRHKPQVVFHAAAYKHVPLMEENPCEAVMVNVYGSRNVADKCVEHGVEMMVMISTDKAVNPTNIMGCSKRIAEMYVQSLGTAIERGEHEGKTKFVTTRFGNVVGSNGSVIPLFQKQIESGGPITVTDEKVVRFFMTIPEACRLVMEAATLSIGNEIFVFDMGEPKNIYEIAKR
ncbi:MAG: polysaccharide biosynthesis protein, partial [Paludibacteraceae bacterium]|nr:polysaccharide biosynthesis protein [Paludibacteraceae bacterium]